MIPIITEKTFDQYDCVIIQHRYVCDTSHVWYDALDSYESYKRWLIKEFERRTETPKKNSDFSVLDAYGIPSKEPKQPKEPKGLPANSNYEAAEKYANDYRRYLQDLHEWKEMTDLWNLMIAIKENLKSKSPNNYQDIRDFLVENERFAAELEFEFVNFI